MHSETENRVRVEPVQCSSQDQVTASCCGCLMAYIMLWLGESGNIVRWLLLGAQVSTNVRKVLDVIFFHLGESGCISRRLLRGVWVSQNGSRLEIELPAPRHSLPRGRQFIFWRTACLQGLIALDRRFGIRYDTNINSVSGNA